MSQTYRAPPPHQMKSIWGKEMVVSIKDLFSYREAECMHYLDRKLNMKFHTFIHLQSKDKLSVPFKMPETNFVWGRCGLSLEAWPSEGFTLLPMEQWVCQGGTTVLVGALCWCSLCARVHGLPSCGGSWICGCPELAVVGVWLSGNFSWEIVCLLFTALVDGEAFP